MREERWHRPLPVRPKYEEAEGRYRWGNSVVATVAVPFDRSPNSAIFNYDDGSDPSFSQALATELAHYPTADGWVSWRPQNICRDRRLYDAWEVEIAWEAPSAQRSVHQAVFQEHAYEHRIRNVWWLRPSLNAAGDYLLPLMTWWALLYGLSVLARYHPDKWTRALQVDKHSETVPLEAALTTAHAVVPHYVLDALLGTPVLFRA